MKLILLGAPGAGKGVQSRIISERFGMPIVASGDILRRCLKSGIANDELAGLSNGRFASDEFVVRLVIEELKKLVCEEYILDGVPRTIEQVGILENNGVHLDCVIYITVSDEVAKKRIQSRLICCKCGAPYIAGGPKVCECCGGILEKRADDNEGVIQERLNLYHKCTEPLVSYYEEKNLLKRIEGDCEIEKVTESLVKCIGELMR
ncbi:MAG: nucleoside monophosphate kinase [Oscillospiraceae bacterium]|jgi:adenylate kinase|nr:nucleoside monophosphate kinase [Oscillospiraceae bacterium]